MDFITDFDDNQLNSTHARLIYHREPAPSTMPLHCHTCGVQEAALQPHFALRCSLCKMTWLLSRKRSVHWERHACSLLSSLLPGLGTHFSKHTSVMWLCVQSTLAVSLARTVRPAVHLCTETHHQLVEHRFLLLHLRVGTDTLSACHACVGALHSVAGCRVDQRRFDLRLWAAQLTSRKLCSSGESSIAPKARQ